MFFLFFFLGGGGLGFRVKELVFFFLCGVWVLQDEFKELCVLLFFLGGGGLGFWGLRFRVVGWVLVFCWV